MADGGNEPQRRPRCQDQEAVVGVLMEHVNAPTQFDSSANLATDRKAFQAVAKSNACLLQGLRKQQGSLGFSKLFLRKCLCELAQKKQEEWGFVDKDIEKFAADALGNLWMVCTRMAKEMRQKKPPKWALQVLGADDQKNEEKDDIEYYVGFDQELNSAWRAPVDDADCKEFTTTFRIPAGATDDDLVEGVWKIKGDTWVHKIAALSVGLYQGRGEAIVPAVKKRPAAHWATSAGGYTIRQQFGEQGKRVKLICNGAGIDKALICQIKSEIDGIDMSEFSRELAQDFLDNKIPGATTNGDTLWETRDALKKERDRRIDGMLKSRGPQRRPAMSSGVGAGGKSPPLHRQHP